MFTTKKTGAFCLKKRTFSTHAKQHKTKNRTWIKALSLVAVMGASPGAWATCFGESGTNTLLSASGTWSNASDWSLGTSPGPGDRVIVPAGATLNIDISADAHCIDVADGATVTMNANTTIANDITIDGTGQFLQGVSTAIATFGTGALVSGINLLSPESRLGTATLPLKLNIANTGVSGIANAGGLYYTSDSTTDNTPGFFSNTGILIVDPRTLTETTYTFAPQAGGSGGFINDGGQVDIRGAFIHSGEAGLEIGDSFFSAGTLVANSFTANGENADTTVGSLGQLSTFGNASFENGADLTNDGFIGIDGGNFTATGAGTTINNNGDLLATGSVNITSGASMTNAFNTEIDGDYIVTNATLVNNEFATISSTDGDARFTDATVTNSGTMEFNGGFIDLDGTTNFQNDATGFTTAAGFRVGFATTFGNAGTIEISTTAGIGGGGGGGGTFDFGSVSTGLGDLNVGSVGTQTLALEINATSDANINMGNFTFRPGPGQMMTVEAAGDDTTGDVPFTPGLGGAPAPNQFAFGDFVIDGEGTVQLVDLVDNLAGTDEAVFVNNLTIIDGTLDANFLNLYILGTLDILGTGQIINQPAAASLPSALLMLPVAFVLMRRRVRK